MASGYIDQLVDWRSFEQFVRTILDQDQNIVVEHDVTAVGKSGARRQIDVKLTHRVGMLTYVTIVECKRWKDRVDRQRIDVLAASLDDLNASKGAMFTTTGYEDGAEKYARDKGIDLFLVRDLTDEEWGLPGRLVWFTWHFYSAQVLRTLPGAARLASIVEQPPLNVGLTLEITRDAVLSEDMTLHSVIDGASGPNLISLVLEARRRAIEILAQDITVFADGAEANRSFLLWIELDLLAYEYRQLIRPYGGLQFETLVIELLVNVKQSRFEVDRGQRVDLALAVENFVTRQRSVAVKGSAETSTRVVDLPEPDEPTDGTDILQNGSLFRVITEPWVDIPPSIAPVESKVMVRFRLPDWVAKFSAS